MRKVGWPTPTGTPWPALPHVPMPSSRVISLPIMEMRCIDSDPVPISVAPFTGAPNLPSLISYASVHEKTNLPEVMSTCPPPKAVAYMPFLTLPRISCGSLSPPSMNVFVMRGMGWQAKLSRRPLPVGFIPMSRAFMRSCI